VYIAPIEVDAKQQSKTIRSIPYFQLSRFFYAAFLDGLSFQSVAKAIHGSEKANARKPSRRQTIQNPSPQRLSRGGNDDGLYRLR
jgi:hypothetical protein